MQDKLFDASGEWSEILTITPDIAAKWLKDYAFSGQRKVNNDHVLYLSNEILAGRFRTSEMRLVHSDKSTALTNGQHRCHAVIRSNKPIRASVFHVSGEYEIASADYQSADINRQRTLQERYNASSLDWRRQLSSLHFNQLGAAMGPIIGGFTPGAFAGNHPIARSLGNRTDAMEFWLPEALKIFEISHGMGVNAEMVTGRRTVFSIALITLKFQPEKAVDFWGGMMADDALARSDQRKVLLAFLRSTRARALKAHVYPRYVALAWNAYFRDESVRTLRVQDPTRDMLILGTPYNGKRIIEQKAGESIAELYTNLK